MRLASCALVLLGATCASSSDEPHDPLVLDAECDGGACALSALQLRTIRQSIRQFEESEVVVKKVGGSCPPGMVPGPPGTVYCYNFKCPGPKAVAYSMAGCSAYTSCNIDDYRKHFQPYWHLLEERAETVGSTVAEAAEAENSTEHGLTCPSELPYLADGRCFRNYCTFSAAAIFTMATNCRFYSSCIIPPRSFPGRPMLQEPMGKPVAEPAAEPVAEPARPVENPVAKPAAKPGPECSAHPKCSAAGLKGNCCPSAGGTRLGCCS